MAEDVVQGPVGQGEQGEEGPQDPHGDAPAQPGQEGHKARQGQAPAQGEDPGLPGQEPGVPHEAVDEAQGGVETDQAAKTQGKAEKRKLFGLGPQIFQRRHLFFGKGQTPIPL